MAESQTRKMTNRMTDRVREVDETGLELYSRFLLERFSDYLRFERGLSERTQDAYLGDCRRFAEFASEQGAATPAAADYSLLRAFTAHLYELGLGGSSVARVQSALRTYFSFLLEEGHTESDPTEHLESPKATRPLPEALSIAQVEQLLTATDPSSFLFPRDLAMLETLYGSGLRISELNSLQRRDLLLDDGLITVEGKGKRRRIVPLGGRATTAVRDYLGDLRERLDRGEGQGVVFLSRHGRPLSRMGTWKMVRRHVLRAGIGQRVTPHTLRHSFATHLLEGGAPLEAVQEMLGHADIATTQIYIHVDRTHLRDVHRSCHPRGMIP